MLKVIAAGVSITDLGVKCGETLQKFKKCLKWRVFQWPSVNTERVETDEAATRMSQVMRMSRKELEELAFQAEHAQDDVSARLAREEEDLKTL
jgi:hypothetical protein